MNSREDTNRAFLNYIKRHDCQKAQYAALWYDGSVELRPSSYTFEGGQLKKGSSSDAPTITIHLPPPFDKGIDFLTFSKIDSKVCCDAVISDCNWLRSSYTWKNARDDAINSPGETFNFDSKNGYWRSAIFELVRDFWLFYTSGVDPRDHKLQEKMTNKKAKVLKPPIAYATPISSVLQGIPIAEVLVNTESSSSNKNKRPHEHLTRRDPPSEISKLLRTAARIPPLVKWLKKRGSYALMNKKQWRDIRLWTETEAGNAWLTSSGLDPLSFHLHHVKAQARGGFDSVFNCVFVPGSANSWWGAADSEEMRDYIGTEACRLSDTHAKWAAVQVSKGVDQSKFDPDFS